MDVKEKTGVLVAWAKEHLEFSYAVKDWKVSSLVFAEVEKQCT